MPTSVCGSCNLKYTLEPDNAEATIYRYQIWFSWINTQCPACHEWEAGFFRGMTAEMLEFLLRYNLFAFMALIQPYAVTMEDFASDEVIQEFEDRYGVRPRQLYELTSRMESEIHALSEWLEHAPDEWISAMFEETAPPKERPDTWID